MRKIYSSSRMANSTTNTELEEMAARLVAAEAAPPRASSASPRPLGAVSPFTMRRRLPFLRRTESNAPRSAAAAPLPSIVARPAAANTGPFITTKFQAGNIPIPFLNTMDTNAKVFFKPKLDAINAKKGELAALAERIQTQHGPLNAAIRNKKALGVLNIGDKSFMGMNGPRVYVAEEGGDYVVRGNFMQNGLPLRASNPNSFNAVLRNMKAKRRNVSQKVGNLRSLTEAVDTLERDYGVKQVELAKLVKTLQKEHEDYLSRRAKEARASRRTVLPAAAPSVMTSAARQALQPPQAPKKPGFFSRIFGRGGTRRRSASRKTRKQRRNRRR